MEVLKLNPWICLFDCGIYSVMTPIFSKQVNFHNLDDILFIFLNLCCKYCSQEAMFMLHISVIIHTTNAFIQIPSSPDARKLEYYGYQVLFIVM